MEEWKLINCGIYYWLNYEGMKNYLQTKDLVNLNQDYHSGIPIKERFLRLVESVIIGLQLFIDLNTKSEYVSVTSSPPW